MKRALGACALILALAVSFMAPASAAQLVLTGGQHPFSSASARCDDAVAATTPSTSGTSSSVQVSGIAAACTGTLFVRVYNSSGVSKATGSPTVVTGGGSQTLPVSPAYTPSATDKVSVTIGTWPVPATWSFIPQVTNVCEVRNADGSVDTTKPCALTSTPSYSFWGSSGSGQGNGGTGFSAPGIANDQYVAFTVSIAGAPSWWSWSNAGLTGVNNGGTVTTSCSALPTFSGQLQPNKGATPNVFVSFVENRTGTPGIVCSVP
jgi:hypothetical protein